MANDELALFEMLKKVYTNKTLYLKSAKIEISFLFAMGHPGAVFYGFVYKRIDYKADYDDETYDGDELVVEKHLEEHIMRYLNKDVVIGLSSLVEHALWRKNMKTVPYLSSTPYYE
jgi:hypothetical protein